MPFFIFFRNHLGDQMISQISDFTSEIGQKNVRFFKSLTKSTFKFAQKKFQALFLLPFPTFFLFIFSFFPAERAERAPSTPILRISVSSARSARSVRPAGPASSLASLDSEAGPASEIPPGIWGGFAPPAPQPAPEIGVPISGFSGLPALRILRSGGGASPPDPPAGATPQTPASLGLGSSPRLATRLRRSARSSLGSAQPRLRPTSGLRQAGPSGQTRFGGRRRASGSDSFARASPSTQSLSPKLVRLLRRLRTCRTAIQNETPRFARRIYFGSQCGMQIFDLPGFAGDFLTKT